MNHIAEARQRIAEAIEVVLPGRINAYPLTKVQRGLAPMAWVDQMRMAPERTGSQSTVWMAVFQVHVVVDGATHAQCALLDDLCAQVLDALEAAPNVSPRSVEPGNVTAESNQVLRGAVINVAAAITARTFCSPDPLPVTVPPEPVPV